MRLEVMFACEGRDYIRSAQNIYLDNNENREGVNPVEKLTKTLL